jgi:TPR repeat protein
MAKLERIAATGEGISNYYLGTLYDPVFKTSKLVSPDLDKSISYYQTATNAGIIRAQEFLMDFYWIPKFGRRDVPKACDIGVKSAAPPTGQVLREVGYCYVDGWGTTKPDLVKAVASFRAASEKGDARATADLGYYYQSGQGNLPQDGDMAVKLYKQAADQKDLLGMYNLGACYETGCGTLPKNTVEAVRLVTLALDGKLDIAINILTTRSSVFSAQFWQELQRQLIKRNVYTGPIDGTPNATLMAAIKHMGAAN